MTQIIRAALIGVGSVGRNFLHILEMKQARLAQQYGVEFRIVCVADSSGVAVNPEGYAPASVRQLKEQGGKVAQLPGWRGEASPVEVLQEIAYDLLLEASPVNLQHGDPGLSAVRAALARGIPVVLANKGPLVLAFAELHQLAQQHAAGLAYSATVCGALPVINIGRRDLIAAEIHHLRGIFNSTTNFILAEMASDRSFSDALAEAQRRGIAETDPTLDVEGWDTANKLVIIANSFLGISASLADVSVQGITAITAAELQQARTQGQTIKLLATATQQCDGYHLSVAPAPVSVNEFLGQCDGWEMGIEIYSDLYGRMYHKLWEREPLPTAAAMLRDAVNLFVNLPALPPGQW